ncbi:hypothetical protein V6N11_066862 [Hibiscus sabdariffa]|uniref:sucrose synthase n=1 Tax=Hibiscus sabdariffa TaxID=183260 RepID=A0ABR2SP00_9ROSI
MADSGITAVHSLRDSFDEALTSHRRNQTLSLLLRIEGKGKGILQRHQIIQEENEKKLNDGEFSEILRATQELTVAEYLRFKEDVVDGSTNGDFVLELDFEPFNASVPRPTLSNRPVTASSSSTVTFRQSCSMTRRACTLCSNSSKSIATKPRT